MIDPLTGERRRWRWGGGRRPIPVAPRGVRILRAGGEEVPVEVRYDGKRRGIHRWVNAYPIALSYSDTILIDVLPGRTEVAINS